jgi:predicted RNA-binding protein with PUA-like domain
LLLPLLSSSSARRCPRLSTTLAQHADADAAMPPRQRAQKQKAEEKEKEPARESKRAKRSGADANDANAATTNTRPATTPSTTTTTKNSPSYWLVKSEPDEYSVDDLAAGKGGGQWDGVRNFSARNFLRQMARGDLCLFYHSSCAVPGVVAIARVTSSEAYPDPTALDKKGKYYDAKHTLESPRWFCVDLALERRTRRQVTLREIKERAADKDKRSVLAGMALLTRPRLSVQPVTQAEWEEILAMEEQEEGGGEER